MGESKKGLSIVVCCFNSVNRLKPTLEFIAKQKVSEETCYEVLIIDNNSSDGTAGFAEKTWSNQGVKYPLKVCFEPNPGLSHARIKGLVEASYEFVLFCDDDNWLSENYLQNALNILSKHKDISVLGGVGYPSFESEKPSWFDTFYMNFAVGKPIAKTGYLKKNGDYLYGAGLILRRSSFQKLCEIGFGFILTDRKGKALSSGGDQELVYALRLIGCRAYFDEKLKFQHFMPQERLKWSYLKKLRQAMHESNFVLLIYRSCLSEEKLLDLSLKGRLKSVLIIIYYSIQYVFSDYQQKQFLASKLILKWNVITRSSTAKKYKLKLIKLKSKAVDVG